MAVFAVMAFAPNTRLERAIRTLFGRDHVRIAPNTWMVAAEASPRELADRLGITDGSNGSAVVVAFERYHGRGPPSMAAWIKSKLDETEIAGSAPAKPRSRRRPVETSN